MHPAIAFILGLLLGILACQGGSLHIGVVGLL